MTPLILSGTIISEIYKVCFTWNICGRLFLVFDETNSSSHLSSSSSSLQNKCKLLRRMWQSLHGHRLSSTEHRKWERNCVCERKRERKRVCVWERKREEESVCLWERKRFALSLLHCTIISCPSKYSNSLSLSSHAFSTRTHTHKHTHAHAHNHTHTRTRTHTRTQ